MALALSAEPLCLAHVASPARPANCAEFPHGIPCCFGGVHMKIAAICWGLCPQVWHSFCNSQMNSLDVLKPCWPLEELELLKLKLGYGSKWSNPPSGCFKQNVNIVFNNQQLWAHLAPRLRVTLFIASSQVVGPVGGHVDESTRLV